MLLLPRSTKIYMGSGPVNMSKSFDGLSNEVRAALRKDPLSGHIFIFFNRRRTLAKLILCIELHEPNTTAARSLFTIQNGAKPGHRIGTAYGLSDLARG